jgi:hypothetical protein
MTKRNRKKWRKGMKQSRAERDEIINRHFEGIKKQIQKMACDNNLPDPFNEPEEFEALRMDNKVLFIVDLYKYSSDWAREIMEMENLTEHIIRARWIPQPIADQIQVSFEFKNQQIRDEFIDKLPDRYRKFLSNKHKEVRS